MGVGGAVEVIQYDNVCYQKVRERRRRRRGSRKTGNTEAKEEGIEGRERKRERERERERERVRERECMNWWGILTGPFRRSREHTAKYYRTCPTAVDRM